MSTILLCLSNTSVLPEMRQGLVDLLPDYTVINTVDEAVMREHADDVVIAVGSVPASVVEAMPNLAWVQTWFAGVDAFLREPGLLAERYTLTNASGIHAISISEHIFGFLLNFARGFTFSWDMQKAGRWQRYPDANHDDVFELYGKTMLIIGVGAIGSRTAHLAKAFGMDVIGVRRDPTKAVEGVDTMVGQDALDSVLPQADVVVVTAPLTAETRCMINADRLRLMKSSAILVNIGRGAVIDEAALVTALREGWIRGAGLDVFTTEPLPEDSPLWQVENLMITPHYSGHSPYYDQRATALFLDNLKCWIAGQPLRNVVDPERGY